MNTSGLVCVTLLSFLDGWNIVEQPIAYIKDFVRYPLSVALAYVPPTDPTLQLVCCILVVLPPLFLFTYFITFPPNNKKPSDARKSAKPNRNHAEA